MYTQVCSLHFTLVCILPSVRSLQFEFYTDRVSSAFLPMVYFKQSKTRTQENLLRNIQIGVVDSGFHLLLWTIEERHGKAYL